MQVGNLDPYFTSIINNIISIESQPLTRLENRVDSISVQRGVYTDMQNGLGELQDLVGVLRSDDPSYALNLAFKAEVESGSDATVLSASVTNSATEGEYSIKNIVLAEAHQVRSDQQVYADQSLGLGGTILIGGAAARSQVTSATIADTVNSFGVSVPLGDYAELGSDTYYVETRNDATAGWQFRLVDGEGNAFSVQKASTAGDYTSSWQAIQSGGGSYDSGRGLTIEFGVDSGLYQAASRTTSNAAELDYTAQGAAIDISATDSLNNIAAAINSAEYADGNEVSASVVDRQLILSAKNTGLNHAIIASDSSGSVLETLGVLTGVGAFKNQMQSASDASFEVNGVSVTRSSNTGIDDVITGVTLNFNDDAVGETATLKIDEDIEAGKNAVKDFLKQFNSTVVYLQQKTSITASSLDGEVSYSRGPLANESIFSQLRSDLFGAAMADSSNSGTYQSLREIGITMDDSLQITISDEGLLDQLLEDELSDVSSLFDAFADKIDQILDRFTSTDGVLDTSLDSLENEKTDVKDDISDLTERLEDRQENLVLQYAQIQAQLLNMQQMQQTWASINSFG